MEAFAAAYLERLEELVKGFHSAIAGLPNEALDWSPGPQMNSLTVLATHTAAAMRYLIGDVAMGDSSHRVREAEFRAVGGDAAALSHRLAEVATYCRTAVTSLTVADLAEVRVSPQHNREFTVAMCLFRSLEHMAEHMGHAQMTRLLWEQRTSKP